MVILEGVIERDAASAPYLALLSYVLSSSFMRPMSAPFLKLDASFSTIPYSTLVSTIDSFRFLEVAARQVAKTNASEWAPAARAVNLHGCDYFATLTTLEDMVHNAASMLQSLFTNHPQGQQLAKEEGKRLLGALVAALWALAPALSKDLGRYSTVLPIYLNSNIPI